MRMRGFLERELTGDAVGLKLALASSLVGGVTGELEALESGWDVRL